MSRTRIALLVVGGLAFLFVVAMVLSYISVKRDPGATMAITAPAPFALLNQPIPDGPNAATLRRGRYLTVAADCVSCHTNAKGMPFAGGLGLATPFGTIYSPNITGDPDTGIGRWTPDQFWRAMTRGIAPGGKHLYPALPYNYFVNTTRPDMDAILAYLKTVPAVRYEQPANRLPIPFDFRPVLIGWNLLFLPKHATMPAANQSPEWRRGSYLVNGLGHCGACHTPKNPFGSDRDGKFLYGGNLENWAAPDLTSNARTGLGGWSTADIVEYLKTGRNARANAAGPMAEVVSFSTSQLSDADLQAIATYLKSVPASPTEAAEAPPADAMRRGGAIYADACAACHLPGGRGQPRYFPALAGSSSTQQKDPTGVLHAILAGARTGPTPTRPTAIGMPSFAWKLTDQQVADVATYVRNSWGNRASAVRPKDAASLRHDLKLTAPLQDH